MKPHLVLGLWFISFFSFAQTTPTDSGAEKKGNIVRVTGVRFAYPMVQCWIDRFNATFPDIQIVIEPRGSQDPSSYDILLEARELSPEIRATRTCVFVARYAVVPIANAQSALAQLYREKGLSRAAIKKIYFRDLFADKADQPEFRVPYTVYTRLQKAGAPETFARHFGFEQKDINGKAIAGSDEHLIKAMLRDSSGISYAPVPLVCTMSNQHQLDGVVIIPVDTNGDEKITNDERIFDDVSALPHMLELIVRQAGDVPINYLHMSVGTNAVTPEALTFLKWIIEHGGEDLHRFGFLTLEKERNLNNEFSTFAAGRLR